MTLALPLGAAGVPVEEINSRAPVVQAPVLKVPATGKSTDTYYLLQLMREEVRQLRGMLEQQSNELAKLASKQQQDYLDLDSRMTAAVALVSSRKAPKGAFRAIPNSLSGSDSLKGLSARERVGSLAPVQQDAQAGFSQQDQRAVYEKAYGLLKAREIDQARAALTKFKDDYPASVYTPNAQYWLGEIYLLQNELSAAAMAFRTVVEEHPGHRKLKDATFKLGKVYHLQNKLPEAKVLLESIATTSGSAGKLAEDYLARHF